VSVTTGLAERVSTYPPPPPDTSGRTRAKRASTTKLPARIRRSAPFPSFGTPAGGTRLGEVCSRERAHLDRVLCLLGVQPPDPVRRGFAPRPWSCGCSTNRIAGAGSACCRCLVNVLTQRRRPQRPRRWADPAIATTSRYRRSPRFTMRCARTVSSRWSPSQPWSSQTDATDPRGAVLSQVGRTA
jgi:hypothetical protein